MLRIREGRYGEIHLIEWDGLSPKVHLKFGIEMEYWLPSNEWTFKINVGDKEGKDLILRFKRPWTLRRSATRGIQIELDTILQRGDGDGPRDPIGTTSMLASQVVESLKPTLVISFSDEDDKENVAFTLNVEGWRDEIIRRYSPKIKKWLKKTE